MLRFEYSAHAGGIPYMLGAAFCTLLICPVLSAAVLWAISKIKGISPDKRGEILEEKVRAYLKASFGVLAARSVLFYIGPCRTTEADLVAVIPQGVLCIECKHRKGKVTGRFTDSVWKVTSVSGRETEMENPVKQNFYHTEAIRGFFRKNSFRQVPILNVVIVEAGKLDIISTEDYSQTYVFRNVREMESLKKLPACLSPEDAELLNVKFRTMQATDSEMKAHVLQFQKP